MVDDVVWGVAEAVERRGGVQVAGDTSAAINIFANALQFGRIVEVSRADGLTHSVPVAACRANGDLLLLHNVRQLLPHLLGLPQHCAAAQTFQATDPCGICDAVQCTRALAWGLTTAWSIWPAQGAP